MAKWKNIPRPSRGCGKGSGRRPKEVTDDEFAKRWEAAFGKKEKK